MDFHLVSEDENFQVYQAMAKLRTEEMTTDDGRTVPAPTKYSPAQIKNIFGVFDEISDAFNGYQVDAVSISKQSGVTVRVAQKKGWESQEEGVTRLRAGGHK